MDNPEKLGTQDKDKQNKNTTQYVLDTTTCKEAQTMQTRHKFSYKQMWVKMNQTSFLCENRSGQHNRTQKVKIHMIGQNVGHHYMQTFQKKLNKT